MYNKILRFWSDKYQKCIDCPSTFSIYQSSICYYAPDEKLLWSDANNTCIALGGNLYIPYTQSDYALLKSLVFDAKPFIFVIFIYLFK